MGVGRALAARTGCRRTRHRGDLASIPRSNSKETSLHWLRTGIGWSGLLLAGQYGLHAAPFVARVAWRSNNKLQRSRGAASGSADG